MARKVEFARSFEFAWGAKPGFHRFRHEFFGGFSFSLYKILLFKLVSLKNKMRKLRKTEKKMRNKVVKNLPKQNVLPKKS